MSFERLLQHRDVWQKKPVLRDIYAREFFTRLHENCAVGDKTLEVGAGPGFFKTFSVTSISSDIIFCPWLDIILDAQALPFCSESLNNIVGLDILHHLASPSHFFTEATRVLHPGGRLVLVEPWITPISYIIWRYLHHEKIDLFKDPFEPNENPYEPNEAIPFLIFYKSKNRFQHLYPELRIITIERFCSFSYLLSLGFKRFCLLPQSFYPLLRSFEDRTRLLWERLVSLRGLIVLEKLEKRISS